MPWMTSDTPADTSKTEEDFDRAYDEWAKSGVAVEPAGEGEALCPKQSRCGGACVRKAGHEGLCLCGGDSDNVPGTCPA